MDLVDLRLAQFDGVRRSGAWILRHLAGCGSAAGKGQNQDKTVKEHSGTGFW